MRALRSKAFVVGGVLALVLIFAALVGPMLWTVDPNQIDVMQRLQKPSAAHPLGTDELGRDLLARLLVGGRVSLWVGFVSVTISVLVGVPLGLRGGYYGGRIDTIIMRCLDAILAFPALLLALAIVAMLGPSLTNAMIAIGIVYVPTFARLTRASVLEVSHADFVDAGRTIGSSDLRLMTRAILPNCLSPLLIQTSVTLVDAVITESALSFLGLGIQLPDASWGSMLAQGRIYLTEVPLYAFSAGVALTALVISLSLLGDELRDLLDPHVQTAQGLRR